MGREGAWGDDDFIFQIMTKRQPTGVGWSQMSVLQGKASLERKMWESSHMDEIVQLGLELQKKRGPRPEVREILTLKR